MLSLIPLFLACGLQVGTAPDPAASTGSVSLRVLAGDCDAEQCDDGAAGGLADALVWVELDGLKPRQGVVTWTDEGPDPSAIVVPAGSTIALRNGLDDRLAVQWNGNSGWDSAVLASRSGRVLHLPADGEVQVSANGQSALVLVGGAGALTDDDGRIALDNLPPGPQTLQIWHPARGHRTALVTVPAGDTVQVEVELRGAPVATLADADGPA